MSNTLTPPAKPSVAATFRNPLLPHGPDPWAWLEGDTYYYLRSNNTAGAESLRLTRTRDLTALAEAEGKTIWEPKDPSHSHAVWAPEIHRIHGVWYVYVAADDGNTDNHQLYVLENRNDDPFEGEFTLKGRLATDRENNWAIDGTVFQHRGELYLIWSGWQERRVSEETQCIYIARMKNPWTLESERVLISKPELEWERRNRNPDGSGPGHTIYVNEGPAALPSPDGRLLHITYSASGCWTPHYCLGLLTARADADLLSPSSWVKAPLPVFEKSEATGVYGTGHHCFVKSPDGTEDWIFYHARDLANEPWGTPDTRSPRLQRFGWDGAGYPVFGDPEPVWKELAKPSGTPP